MIIALILTSLALILAWAFSKRRSRTPPTSTLKQTLLGSSQVNAVTLKQRVFGYVDSLCWLIARVVGLVPSGTLRGLIYKHIFFVKLSGSARISIGCELICPWNIVLGRNSVIGVENKIDGRGGVFIGSNVNMSHQVNVWTMQHDVNDPDFSPAVGSVVIEDYVWLGNRVIVLPGVTIAEGCVIAAGAVVTKSTGRYGIYAGVPAKRVGERSELLRYNLEFSHVF